MNTNKVIGKIHFERFETFIKYIEQKAKNGLELKRKDILNIIGVGEGDSAKAIFRILNEMPEVYSSRMVYEKREKTYYFAVANTNIALFTNQEVMAEIPALWDEYQNKYMCFISARQLIDWWKSQFLTYNPLIQRGQITKIDKEGNIIIEDVCSENNIKEIAKLILSKNYVTDTLTINVWGCKLTFANGIVRIIKNDDSEVNILDGQHREKGLLLCEELMQLKDYDVDLDKLKFPVQIENLPISKAQVAFSQFAKGLKISTTRAEYFNNIDKHNIMLKSIIEKSILKDKVETVKDTIPANSDKIVTFGTLISSFKAEFSEEELTADVENYMVDYFNQLYGNVVALNDNEVRKQVKKESLVAENITFYGYMGLAKRLYNQHKAPKDYVVKINDIDLQKSSEIWNGTVLLKGKRGLSITNKKGTRKYLRDTFVSMILE